jgi:hypothetical protein
LLRHQHINSFILHYYGAEVGRNTDDKKSKQVFMTSLHSRKMPRIFAGCEKNYKSRRSKLQAKSYHLGNVTWKNPPLTLVKCGGLPMGHVVFLYFFLFLYSRPDSALVSFLDLEDPVSPPSY